MIAAARRAFTLIELLVVVTIIIVLLALLAPAMDQAVYQAELAVCGSKLHAITTGAIAYASESKRRYPHRPSLRSAYPVRAFQINDGDRSAYAAASFDDRPILRQFLSINKTLMCPLAKAVDLENSQDGTFIASNFGMSFGFQYAQEKGMFRLGDRLTWDGYESTVLAFDFDKVDSDLGHNYGSHPDHEGTMIPYWFQDSDWTGSGNEVPGLMVTWSFWFGERRSAIDANYGFDDGSVVRFNGVTWDEGDPKKTGADERVIWFPEYSNAHYPPNYIRVPRTH